MAVCGAGLYFLRSFKPALARDYDVFFAAIGLLCGGILFFQGWRLDPILQFGQFLLAGTTVFFAYESVRLRGIATDQARRSSYFDDEPAPETIPSGSLNDRWDDSYERFEESPRIRRRFSAREREDPESVDGDFYRPRRTSRAAIPEQAASRRIQSREVDEPLNQARSRENNRMNRFSREEDFERDRGEAVTNTFGERRNMRQEQRRGSRPIANQRTSNRRSNVESRERTTNLNQSNFASNSRVNNSSFPAANQNSKAEDAAFYQSDSINPRTKNQPNNSQSKSSSSYSLGSRKSRLNTSIKSPKNKRRDNSSRFDD